MKLARYNEIIMALVGTSLLLLILVIAGFAAVFNLRPEQRPGVVIRPPQSETPVQADKGRQNLVFCPSITESSGTFQYIPVGVVSATNADSDAILGRGSNESKASYGGIPSCENYLYGSTSRTFNVVVRNLATGSQRLLLDHPAQIVRVEPPAEKCTEGKGPAPCGFILWEIRDKDTNHDGVINSKDALTAYVSSLDATKLVALTSSDATVLSIEWNSKTEKWEIQVRKDTNKDGKFTAEDGSELLEADTKSPSLAQAFIQQPVINALEATTK